MTSVEPPLNPIAAFFDIDCTVLEVNSGTKWIRYQRRTGALSLWQLLEAMAWLGQYKLGVLNYEAMAAKVLARHRGDEVQPLYDEVNAWFTREVRATITEQARARLAEHRNAGHTLALLTSATPFLGKAVADALDVPHVLCTQLEVVRGRLTGVFEPPACYGVGKVAHAERFARVHNLDLARSFFYTDSVSDLPMLERVGRPQVVNPDLRLRRIAAARGWPTARWRAPEAAGA